MNFEINNTQNTPEEVENMFAEAKRTFGKVPNLQQAMATSPQLLKGYQFVYALGNQTSFSALERQVIYLTISYYNDCNYCMAAHSFQAEKRDKMPPGMVNNLRNNEALSNPKLETLRLFVRQMLQTNGQLQEGDFELLAAQGYSEQHVLEIVLLLAVKIMSNYTNHITQPNPDRGLEAYIWEKDK